MSIPQALLKSAFGPRGDCAYSFAVEFYGVLAVVSPISQWETLAGVKRARVDAESTRASRP